MLDISATNAAWIGAVIGAIAGGVVAWPLNRVLGCAFRSFNRAFDWTTKVYTWSVGKLLRVIARGRVRLWRAAVPDLYRLRRRPRVLFPRRTKAIWSSICSCPIAHRSAAREEVMQRIEKIAASDAGRQAYGGHFWAVDFAGRELAELRRHVRDARRFSQPLGPRAYRRDAIAAALQTKLQTEITDGVVNVLARRRWKAWAPPADSRS